MRTTRKGAAFPHIGGHSPKEFLLSDLFFKEHKQAEIKKCVTSVKVLRCNDFYQTEFALSINPEENLIAVEVEGTTL